MKLLWEAVEEETGAEPVVEEAVEAEASVEAVRGRYYCRTVGEAVEVETSVEARSRYYCRTVVEEAVEVEASVAAEADTIAKLLRKLLG